MYKVDLQALGNLLGLVLDDNLYMPTSQRRRHNETTNNIQRCPLTLSYWKVSGTPAPTLIKGNFPLEREELLPFLVSGMCCIESVLSVMYCIDLSCDVLANMCI